MVESWYGWQILVAYGVSLGVLLLSPLERGDAASVTVPIGVTGLAFSGPIVHWAHSQWAKGFASLGLNLGGTVVGGLLGGTLFCVSGGCSGNDFEGLGVLIGASVGGCVGALTGMIIDVAALAYEEHEAPRAWAGRPLQISLVPSLNLAPDRAVLGMAGTF